MVNEEISSKVISMLVGGGKNIAQEVKRELANTVKKGDRKGGLKNYLKSECSEVKMKDMAKKDQLEEIETTGRELKELKKELNRNGVRFSVMRDKETRNYTVFFQAKDIGIMERAFRNAVHTSERKADQKESVKQAIDKFKEMIKNVSTQDKDRHKRREQSR